MAVGLYLSFLLIGALLCIGLRFICDTFIFKENSVQGRRTLGLMEKWQRQKQSIRASKPMRQLCALAEKIVYLEASAESKLRRQLERAGLPLTPRQFTARKYVILGLGALTLGVFALMRFYVGLVFAALLVFYLTLKQRDTLASNLKTTDEAIAQEMPRFVRTICRNLRSSRDLRGVMQAYRKIAGSALRVERTS